MIKKTAENDQNCYVAEKRIVFKLSKISVSNFDSTNSRPFLLYFLRNNSSKSVTVGLGRFIVLNDSASPKIVLKMYFNFSDIFLKVLIYFNDVEATHKWLLIKNSFSSLIRNNVRNKMFKFIYLISLPYSSNNLWYSYCCLQIYIKTRIFHISYFFVQCLLNYIEKDNFGQYIFIVYRK